MNGAPLSGSYLGPHAERATRPSVDVQSVPRLIAASDHAPPGIPFIKEENRKPLLDYLGSPCRLFGRRSQQGRVAERKAMIEREHELPIKRQAELLGISRGTEYYHPEPIPEAELALMRRITELHLE